MPFQVEIRGQHQRYEFEYDSPSNVFAIGGYWLRGETLMTISFILHMCICIRFLDDSGSPTSCFLQHVIATVIGANFSHGSVPKYLRMLEHVCRLF